MGAGATAVGGTGTGFELSVAPPKRGRFAASGDLSGDASACRFAPPAPCKKMSVRTRIELIINTNPSWEAQQTQITSHCGYFGLGTKQVLFCLLTIARFISLTEIRARLTNYLQLHINS
jgi:hypothetical protein